MIIETLRALVARQKLHATRTQTAEKGGEKFQR
jgi:hypothetical protein